MDFYEKPDLENIRKDRENRAYLHNRYHARFLVSTIAMILVGIVLFLNQGKMTEKPEPTQHDLEIAENLTTIEGREFSIAKEYDGAKIIAEKTFGNDIISVFEVDAQHSFCVFEATEDGYWQEYCGNLFPKTDLVKGTVYLGDNSHEYDIYLQGTDAYDYMMVRRTNTKKPYDSQEEYIHFDESGIALMKLDPEITDPAPRLIAYDNGGYPHILADGT